jgi:putative MATE family efflux protein
VKPNLTEKQSNISKNTNNNETNGVQTLLGDPKKAIIKLAIPMIIAMSITTIYNLADAIWVSGLGSDALAAVGFVFPFFFMAIAIANGLGIGGGAAISRKIGAKDKEGADTVAVHTLVIMLIISILFTVIFFIFARDIFIVIGAGKTLAMATVYARIVAIGTVAIFFSFIANAILRAEGDVNRAMHAMALGAVLNIALDPIFIYTFDLGVAGAAWATLLSMSVSSLLLFYWLFLKKNTYISFHFRSFHFNKSVIKDIFRVSFPASVMQLSMSITMLIMNIIIIKVGIINGAENPQDGIAVFTVGWRVATLATMPLIGIATAVVSVTGAAYGALDYNKLNISYMHAIKIGIIIEAIIALFVFFFAPTITVLFTLAETSAHLAPDIIIFLRISCISFPGIAFGMLSSSMFQGTGHGMNALIVTIFRTIILTIPFAWFFSITVDMGLPGAWWGMVAANLIGSSVAFIWAKIYIKKLQKSPNSIAQ